MRFLVDAQLPVALARLLVSERHVADHVADLSLHIAADSEIWQVADREGAIIITKDEDFALRAATSISGPSVVWIRVGNTRKAALLSWFSKVLPEIEAALARGDRLVEVGSRVLTDR